MVRIFEADETEFDTNGLGVLTPSSCDVAETLNGNYEMVIKHPIDDGGKWKRIAKGRILVDAVPVAGIQTRAFRVIEYETKIVSKRTSYIKFTPNYDENRNITSISDVVEYGGERTHNNAENLVKGAELVEWQGYKYAKCIDISGDSCTHRCIGHGEFGLDFNAGKLIAPTASSLIKPWSGAFVEFGSSDNSVSEYLAQPQIKDQPFRIYRVCPGIDEITAYAKHIFYDLQYDEPNIGVDASPPYNATTLNSDLINGGFTFVVDGLDDFFPAMQEVNNPLEHNLVDLVLGSGGAIPSSSGEILRNGKVVYCLPRIGVDAGVVIREKKNLNGFKIDTSDEGAYTRVIPYGRDNVTDDLPEYLHWRPLGYFDGSARADGYITSAKDADYPFPRWKSICVADADMRKTGMTKLKCAELMREAAQKVFDGGGDNGETSVDVDFVMLDTTEEYKDIAGLEKVFLGDSVRVISPRLNVDTYVRVNSYTFDCLAKRYKKIKMESDARRNGLLGVIQDYTSGTIIKNYSGATASAISIDKLRGMLT